MDLTVDVVREWLTANKGQEPIKAFLKELGQPVLTAETVGPWLATDEGKKYIEPIIDRERTRAVKTHDDKTKEERADAVKKAVEDAVAKANPKETAEQKSIRDLTERLEKSERASKEKELRLALSEKARAKGVDTFLPGDYLPSDLTAAEAEMDRINKAVEERVNKTVNEKLAGGHKPGSGSNGSSTKTDPTKLTVEQAVALELAGKLDETLAAN